MQARWHSGHLHFPLACILDHSFEQRRLPSQCALHLNLRPAVSCQVNILQTYVQAWRRKMGNFALSAAFELLRHSADWPLDRWLLDIALSLLTIPELFMHHFKHYQQPSPKAFAIAVSRKPLILGNITLFFQGHGSPYILIILGNITADFLKSKPACDDNCNL